MMDLKHRSRDPLSLQPGSAVDAATRKVRKSRYSAAGETDGIAPLTLVGYVVTAILCLFLLYSMFSYFETKHDEQIRQEIRQKEIGFLSRDLEKKFEKLEKDNKYLTKRLEDAEMERARYQEQLENTESTDEKLRKQIEYLSGYKQRIHQAIQTQQLRMIREKYGPGPFQIEIQLAFDPNSNVASMEGGESLVIETAPIEDMPHTLWLFLEQVDRGLYDGCSFHRNAGHVIQGGPAPNFLTSPGAQLAKRFKTAGLESVLFQEYSPKFPHVKFTLGLAGRPGGPDFYISTRDNTRNHGPGGQQNYDDPSEADPCFAKVISGFEAVERMHKAEVKDQGYMHMSHNIAIVHMKILGRETPPPN